MNDQFKLTRKDFLRTVSLSSIALLPGYNILAELMPGGAAPEDKYYIDCAFRLMQYQTLLNLEFYFINVKYDQQCNKILSSPKDYGAETYMMVRLPQQHVAEQYKNSVDLKIFCGDDGQDLISGTILHTAISGYSYLCFQIDFSLLPCGMHLDAEHLLDWNAPHFDLVVRDVSEKPLFELKTNHPNNYPLGYNGDQPNVLFDKQYFPNVTPDKIINKKRPLVQRPITAIEAPYRVLISPFRPSIDYEFHWVFSFYATTSKNDEGAREYELWTATLKMQKTRSLNPSPVGNAARKDGTIPQITSNAAGTNGATANAIANGKNAVVEMPLQLMILGSPDIIFDPANKYKSADLQQTDTVKPKIKTGSKVENILPQSLPDITDRININELGRTGITGAARSMTFTPIGICMDSTFINPDPKGNNLVIVKWHQCISFGRDQQVEVAELVMEGTLGLKMLYIRTTRRETVRGNSMLVYREFLMPYENSKDYLSYDNKGGSVYKDPNNKFNSPASKISFRDKNAKQILPLQLMNDHIYYPENQVGNTQVLTNHPLSYFPVTPGRKFLEWEFDIMTHGQNTPTQVAKKIYIVTTHLAQQNAGTDVKAIFALDPVEINRNVTMTFNDCYSLLNTKGSDINIIDQINNKWDKTLRNASNNIWPKVMHFSEEFQLNKVDLYRKKIDDILPAVDQWIKDNTLTKVTDYQDQAAEAWGTFKRNLFDAQKGFTEHLEGLDRILTNEIQQKIDNIKAAITKNISNLQQDELDCVNSISAMHKMVVDQVNKNIPTGDLNLDTALKKLIADLSTPVKMLINAYAANISADIQTYTDAARKVLTDVVLPVTIDLTTAITYFDKGTLLGKGIPQLREKEDSLKATITADIDTFRKAFNERYNAYKSEMNRITDEINGFAGKADKMAAMLNGYKASINGKVDSINTFLAGKDPLAPGNIKTIGLSMFPSYATTCQKLIDRGADIQKAVTIGVELYKKQLFEKLPQSVVNKFRSANDQALNLLSTLTKEINHVEGNLKTKLDCAKAEIGYAVNEVEDELKSLKAHIEDKFKNEVDKAKKISAEYERVKQAYTEEVNAKISTMKTDFIIFRNNFKQAATTQMFDFYHDHACFPQMHTAQAYAASVKDMVNTDIPLKIKYAEDYLKSQVDNKILETQTNAAKVFAEIKSDARELLKGAMRSVANELGGMASPQMGDKFLTFYKDKKSELNDLKNTVDVEYRHELGQATKYASSLLNQYDKELRDAKGELFSEYHHLVAFTDEVKARATAEADEIKAKGEEFFTSLEAKIVGSIHLKDLLAGVDFKVPKMKRQGNKLIYQFVTKDGDIVDVPTPGNQFKFVARSAGVNAQLSIYLEKDITNTSNFKSVTQVSNFTIAVFSERLLINVQKIEFLTTAAVKNKSSIKLGKIEFAQELEFLMKLAEGVKLPGTGLTLHVTPQEVSVDFTFKVPTIATGAFTLDNLKFNFGISIPLPIGPAASHEPMTTKLGVNSPDDKFTIGVLVFGGKGHFVLETTPRYIRRIDTELDFGGNLQLDIVIASGNAYLMAGIRYVYTRDDVGYVDIKFFAILTCGASLTVFGFINISVVFSMYLTYDKSGDHAQLSGTCTISCSVSIGFFSRSFDLTMTKIISGTGDADGQAYVNPKSPSYMLQDEDGLWTERREEPGMNHQAQKTNDIYSHLDPCAWDELVHAYNF